MVRNHELHEHAPELEPELEPLDFYLEIIKEGIKNHRDLKEFNLTESEIDAIIEYIACHRREEWAGLVNVIYECLRHDWHFLHRDNMDESFLEYWGLPKNWKKAIAKGWDRGLLYENGEVAIFCVNC